MFDQTFVDGAEKTNKPLSLLASTLIQISVLAILLLIPLVYTATLPGPVFKSLLVAPRPPVAAAPVASKPKIHTGRMIPVFSGTHLFAPMAIPKPVNPASDAGAPPDLGPAGVAGLPDGPGGAPLAGFGNPIPSPPAPPEPPKAKPISGPVHVGTGVAEANLVYKVVPVYPLLAKSARIQGAVEFSATISKNGNIENLQVVRGHPLLINAAKEAVLQWKYRPTLLNGQPVEVLTEIAVNFTLRQ